MESSGSKEENKNRKKIILCPRSGECLVETSVLLWKNSWVRLEFIRKNFPGSDTPGINFARVRDLASGDILCRCMEGFELHSAYAEENAFYVFATDYWNIYMSKTFDFQWWSRPVMVLNNHDRFIQHQNNSVCFDGRRYVMAVDLLGGPYNFTVCFACSYGLQDFRYIPAAVYRSDLYTSSPRLYYSEGMYYLLHVCCSSSGNSPVYEQFITRSPDLIHWFDSPLNPVLSPDPSYRIRYTDGTEKPECNVSDLNVYEKDGLTWGDFSTGTQEAFSIPTYRHFYFEGGLNEFFLSFYE